VKAKLNATKFSDSEISGVSSQVFSQSWPLSAMLQRLEPLILTSEGDEIVQHLLTWIDSFPYDAPATECLTKLHDYLPSLAESSRIMLYEVLW